MIRVGVDAGGTSTRARLIVGAGEPPIDVELGTASPFALDSEAAALEAWQQLADRIRSIAGDQAVSAVVASSAHTDDTLGFSGRVGDQLASRFPAGSRIRIVNDIVPLLFAPPLRGEGAAVIAGTGSAVLARSAGGATAYGLGLEWLLSDSGSAYAIGRVGLRAAIAAHQRIGPPTRLEQAARAAFGVDLPTLARRLAVDPAQKPTLASFARQVDLAATAGDAVAGEVLDHEAAQLGSAISACLAQVSDAPLPVIACGSLIARSVRFRDAAVRAVGERASAVHVVPDALDCCLALAGDPACSFDGFAVVDRST